MEMYPNWYCRGARDHRILIRHYRSTCEAEQRWNAHAHEFDAISLSLYRGSPWPNGAHWTPGTLVYGAVRSGGCPSPDTTYRCDAAHACRRPRSDSCRGRATNPGDPYPPQPPRSGRCKCPRQGLPRNALRKGSVLLGRIPSLWSLLVPRGASSPDAGEVPQEGRR